MRGGGKKGREGVRGGAHFSPRTDEGHCFARTNVRVCACVRGYMSVGRDRVREKSVCGFFSYQTDLEE